MGRRGGLPVCGKGGPLWWTGGWGRGYWERSPVAKEWVSSVMCHRRGEGRGRALRSSHGVLLLSQQKPPVDGGAAGEPFCSDFGLQRKDQRSVPAPAAGGCPGLQFVAGSNAPPPLFSPGRSSSNPPPPLPPLTVVVSQPAADGEAEPVGQHRGFGGPS